MKWNERATGTQEWFKDGTKIRYWCPKLIPYWSKRYQKWIIVELGMPSDGASGAIDINSIVWWVHDKGCYTGKFEDGTLMTNWQLSMIAHDILHDDYHSMAKSGRYWTAIKRRARSMGWFVATFAGGGGEARKNGMWKV